MLKIFNFYRPFNTPESTLAYSGLTYCVTADFSYKQAAELCEKNGYYIPEDQYLAFKKVLDIEIRLAIGNIGETS